MFTAAEKVIPIKLDRTKNRLRFVNSLSLVFALFCFPDIVSAKAYFASIPEMVAEADAIAIVKVNSVRPLKMEEQNLNYKDMVASAQVQKTILGNLPETLEIHVPNFFPCAVVDISSGTYLIFLKHKMGRWTNSNWHVSIRPMQNEKVSWFSNTNDAQNITVEEVRHKIQAIRTTSAHKDSPNQDLIGSK